MKWILPAEKPKKSELIDFILKQRGINDTKYFLNPDKSHIHDPFLMFGMKEVAESILEAIKNKKKIIIHGDFDVDGVTGTSIMFDFLYRELGADVIPVIPNRFTDGYGLSDQTMKKAKDLGGELIITVDCGIKDVEIVEKYKNDFEFIITDHHTLLSSIDENNKDIVKKIGDHYVSKAAIAVTHPKLKNQYPFSEICGAAVSFKVCQAVNELNGGNVDMDKYLDLAMMGTICDIMPLIDENRSIVKYGIELIHFTQNEGIKALCKVAGIDFEAIEPYHIGYVLGPRINAAGRIEDATEAVRLLTTNSKQAAEKIALKLDSLNRQRQDLTKEYTDIAEEQLQSQKGNKVHFILGEDWPEGIIGLIAGKLTQQYNRPVLVASNNDGVIKGSARSIETYNIANTLKDLDHFLVRHGGHAGAAGFQIDPESISKFTEALFHHGDENITDADLEKLLFIDSKIDLDDLSFDLVDALYSLQPFGNKNEEPIFAFENLNLLEPYIFGSDNQHIKTGIPGRDDIEFISFGNASKLKPLIRENNVNLAGVIGTNEWNGNKKLQIRIKDIKKDS